MMGNVGGYWQVYAACMAAALACLVIGAGFGYFLAAERYHRRHGAHRARDVTAVPVPLPELPPAAAAALEVRHANVMARSAPHEIPALVRAAVAVAAVRAALAAVTVAASVAAHFSQDCAGERPWQDATGTFTLELGDLTSDRPAA